MPYRRFERFAAQRRQRLAQPRWRGRHGGVALHFLGQQIGELRQPRVQASQPLPFRLQQQFAKALIVAVHFPRSAFAERRSRIAQTQRDLGEQIGQIVPGQLLRVQDRARLGKRLAHSGDRLVLDLAQIGQPSTVPRLGGVCIALVPLQRRGDLRAPGPRCLLPAQLHVVDRIGAVVDLLVQLRLHALVLREQARFQFQQLPFAALRECGQFLLQMLAQLLQPRVEVSYHAAEHQFAQLFHARIARRRRRRIRAFGR
ncbi:hypothetical protein ACM9XD_02410 [Xanthomonas sacchari]